MSNLRQAAQQALETFERMSHEDSIFAGEFDEEITALRAALAEPEPEQEPVAWMDREGDVYKKLPSPNWCPPHTPLYAHPPTPRKPLTMEQLHGIREHQRLLEELGPVWAPMLYYFCQSIERAHGVGSDA